MQYNRCVCCRWEDGLYISSVASCANLWAIVMDAGTEFTQQIYKVHYNSFLPKVGVTVGLGCGGPQTLCSSFAALRQPMQAEKSRAGCPVC